MLRLCSASRARSAEALSVARARASSSSVVRVSAASSCALSACSSFVLASCERALSARSAFTVRFSVRISARAERSCRSCEPHARVVARSFDDGHSQHTRRQDQPEDAAEQRGLVAGERAEVEPSARGDDLHLLVELREPYRPPSDLLEGRHRVARVAFCRVHERLPLTLGRTGELELTRRAREPCLEFERLRPELVRNARELALGRARALQRALERGFQLRMPRRARGVTSTRPWWLPLRRAVLGDVATSALRPSPRASPRGAADRATRRRAHQREEYDAPSSP